LQELFKLHQMPVLLTGLLQKKVIMEDSWFPSLFLLAAVVKRGRKKEKKLGDFWLGRVEACYFSLL
jgi:hypothetical protein